MTSLTSPVFCLAFGGSGFSSGEDESESESGELLDELLDSCLDLRCPAWGDVTLLVDPNDVFSQFIRQEVLVLRVVD